MEGFILRSVYPQQLLDTLEVYHGGDPCTIIGYVSTLTMCIYRFIRRISKRFLNLTVNSPFFSL